MRLKHIITATVASMLAVTSVLSSGVDSSRIESSAPRELKMKQSVNYESGHFVNEIPTSTLELGELWLPLKDELIPPNKCRPKNPLPFIPVDAGAFDTLTGLNVVWLGHSSMLVRIDGVTLLFDPVFDEYAKHAMGKSLRFQPSPVAQEKLPPIDAVIISHDHFDHLERTTVEYLSAKGTIFFVPLGVGALLEEWLVPDSLIVELDWWASAKLRSLDLVCTPARHFSGRTFATINRTLWSTWVVIGPDHRLFFGGDTGYYDRFEDIGKRYGPFDMTMIPIGAYDDAWADIHLCPEEAAIVHKAVDGELMIPIHWGAFDLASHRWNEPIKRMVEAAVAEEVSLTVPRLGEVVNPDRPAPFDPWWRTVE